MRILDITGSGEELISLADAAKLLPTRGGKRISIRTLERWIRHGHRGLFLEAARLGCVFYTSREAIQRFNVSCMNQDVAKNQLPSAALKQKREPQLQSRSYLELVRAGWAGRNISKTGSAEQ